MIERDTRQLEALALRVREHIIRMATDGGCFVGSALSCADLLVYLYGRYLNISLANLDDPTRDFLFLSKGHAVPALYGTLAEVGILDSRRLANHLQVADDIYWHPNRRVPGVEFPSGSLGHLLPVAVGVALDCRMRRQHNRVVVVTGDGELNEGSNWEGLLVAAAMRLDNLLVIVDRNAFQANMRTEALIGLEPLSHKFRSFGAAVRRVSGHDFDALDKALADFPFEKGTPGVLVADTIRGRGLPSIEERADLWFAHFSQAEADRLLDELHSRPVMESIAQTVGAN